MPKSFGRGDATKIDFGNLSKRSPLLWSMAHIPLPKGAAWDFTGRSWQIDIFEDVSPMTVFMKPTQIGLTTINLSKYLFFAVHHDCRLMYTLPRQDDVTDLVTSRLDEIIRNSPVLRSLSGNVNNVRMKSLGGSFLHFMEASVPPRMLDVDYLVHDEVDLSNQANLEQYASRLDASAFRELHRLSTPTISSYGIHALYESSDKKKWFVKCPRCNSEFFLEWSLHFKSNSSKSWYACDRCGKEITAETIDDGRWIATGNGNSSISGYSISQMMTPTLTPPARLKQQSESMSPKNFANLRLGEPFAPTVGGISRSGIYSSCFDSGHSRGMQSGDVSYFLGADQGNELHVAIGCKVGNKLFVVHLEKISFESGFERLEYLIRRYRITKGIVDALPNRHSAYQVARNFNGRIRLATFSDIDSIFREDGDDRVIINKHDAYDNLSDLIDKGRIQFYGSRSGMDSGVSDAVEHLTNMRRDEVVRSTRSGGEINKIVWVNTGPDHYADTLLYLSIAADDTNSGRLNVHSIGNRPSLDSGNEFNQNPYARRRRRGIAS